MVWSLVDELEASENQGTKSHTVPTIMILTPDTANSMAISKTLTEAYPLKDTSLKYLVKVHRLFSKGMKVEDQKAHLKMKNKEKVLNIYVGVPNRMRKLQSDDAFDIGIQSDRFRYMLIDCSANSKSYSIFEVKETRVDTLELIKLSSTALDRGSLKLILCK